MRPRFELQTATEPADALAAIGALIARENDVRGKVFRKTAVMWLHRNERRFYSPWLNVDVESREGGARIQARFSPHPNVWTGFMAGYGVLSLITLGALVYGYVQWTLGKPPWALAIAPAAIALIGFEYGAAFIGQGLAAEQMHVLHSHLERLATTGGGGDAGAGAGAGEDEEPEGL